jgi:hypothetical protein
MVFGQKAYDNIMPWLRTHYSQKFLIQNVLLSHPQNIQWRYLLEHARNYIETFRAIMNLLGVDIPPLEGVVQLRFLMTKKRTLDMIEFVEGFVNSEVLEAVHQRTDKVKIARTAKVEEMMKALNHKEAAKAVAALAAAAVARRKVIQEAAVVAALAAARRKAIQEAAAVAVPAAPARRKVIQDVEPVAVPAAAARRKVIQEAAVVAAVAAASNDPFIRFQIRSQLQNIPHF